MPAWETGPKCNIDIAPLFFINFYCCCLFVLPFGCHWLSKHFPDLILFITIIIFKFPPNKLVVILLIVCVKRANCLLMLVATVF